MQQTIGKINQNPLYVNQIVRIFRGSELLEARANVVFQPGIVHVRGPRRADEFGGLFDQIDGIEQWKKKVLADSADPSPAI